MSLHESNQGETTDKTATETTALTNSEATSNADDTCVVCFKNVEIYSIGECDHPVCYECSTRMRVLCQQNECPICRQVLGKVIFTFDKLPYRELEAKNRSDYYNKRYKIGFYSNDIQKRFFELLDHPCPKCNTMPYRSFQGLRDHVCKEHSLYYCDLCVDNLKIFTFERRCYTQSELGLHRRKGDPDNKSHRGHPLCEYCNKRYLDRDELFRHLRREHYFCHFCDADGCNEFYKDYDALAEHFRQDHYLCEEGKCATEQFVGAFRTEIDYKAHIASVHGKTLNKQQAKQTRTLQLEITLGPRGRGQAEQNVANMRSRGNEDVTHEIDVSPFYAQHQSQRPVTIDSQNEQDFPSLSGGSGSSAPVVPLMPFPMRRSLASGLARTKENFPALGGGGGGLGVPPQRGSQQQNQQQGPPISSMLKKQSTANNNARSTQPTSGSGNSGNGSSMVIHVSNRPAQGSSVNGAIAKKPTTPNADFPALPSTSSVGKGKKQNHQQPVQKQQPTNHHQYLKTTTNNQFQHQKQQQVNNQPQHQKQPQLQTQKSVRALDEDMITTPSSNVPVGVVAAKHRILMDDYVSVANPKNFQKFQMIQQEETETQLRKNAAERLKTAPKLSSEELFPSLGGNSSTSNIGGPSAGNWSKPISDKRQRELENRKAKVAPAPLLPIPKENKSSANKTVNSTTKEKKSKEKNFENSGDQSKQQHNQNKSNAKNKEKNNYNNSNSNNDNRNKSNPNMHENDNETSKLRPPPGFTSGKSDKTVTKPPPPGFLSDVTVNSVAKSPNNLIFTSSMGENYSIVPKHKYSQPSDSLERNQKLVNDFQNAMSCIEAFQQFHVISQRFREGLYKADAYYEHCQAALNDKFDILFPELLVLLPDISKQQALYLEHAQRLNTMTPAERKLLPQLEVCAICKQVVLSKESDAHQRMHEFPSLLSNKLNATGKRK